jgi:hypothetical protein
MNTPVHTTAITTAIIVTSRNLNSLPATAEVNIRTINAGTNPTVSIITPKIVVATGRTKSARSDQLPTTFVNDALDQDIDAEHDDDAPRTVGNSPPMRSRTHWVVVETIMAEAPTKIKNSPARNPGCCANRPFNTSLVNGELNLRCFDAIAEVTPPY